MKFQAGHTRGIPSLDFCYALMDAHQMLDNIRAHSILVARIAELISRELIRVGIDLSLELAVTGGLLHDIGKTPCLNTQNDHAAVGRDICLAHGLEDIAEIVGEHVILRNYYPDLPLCEKTIVYYADKRVNHDQVVSLDQRLDYILETYGRNNPSILRAIENNFSRCHAIEKRLFHHLDFAPENISQILANSTETLLDRGCIDSFSLQIK